MDFGFVNDFLGMIAGWMRPYLSEIGLSMAATLLVVFGNEITLIVRKQIGSLQLFLRITLFVLFCAFGFAFLTSWVTPLIVSLLADLNNFWLPFVVVGAFYGIGLLAQRKGMI